MAQQPPVAPIKNVTDDYHGTKIVDPYRYMEDFTSPAVQEWVKGQAEFAAAALAALSGRDQLLKRIVELDTGSPYTLSGVTRLANGDLFYFKQLAKENVAKVYRRDGRTGQERLLIDPESFAKSEPGQHFTISFYRVSPNGLKLLYGFAASGSEQTSLKVFDLATSKDLPDVIDRLESDYALPSWLPDSQSFVYSRRRLVASDASPTEGYKFTQAFRHAIGDDVESAKPVFAHGAVGSPVMAEMDFPAIILSLNSQWAIGQVKHGDETDISLYALPHAALGSPNAKWKKVCDRECLVTDFEVRGDDIYLLTARDAPRFKVIRTSLFKPDLAAAETIVPAGDYVVNSLAVAQDALYVGLLDGVPRQILKVSYDRAAKPQRIQLLAEEASASVIAAQPDVAGVLIRTDSWTRAGSIYHYATESPKLTDSGLVARGKFDSPDWLTSLEVKVKSHDGVEVPLSIIHRRNLPLDGSHPALLSGYGAYGFTSSPHYDAMQLAWLERGGVLAVAHVRGGGALGKPWHHAGRRLTKPNTWKDFIACAEHLVKAGYTSPQRLAGKGGSAGGILIGRAITERPDLFAAAQISVGCTDMLRFETTMNGPPNIPEFGTVTKEDEFRGLLAMSTYHHIEDGTKYPAVLLTHGIHDPRVEPWESAKTAARLQAATSSGKPVLFRVEYHAGHGIGSTRQQRQAELADVWSFMLWQAGDESFQLQ
jgi:prolyl oligopeptidase